MDRTERQREGLKKWLEYHGRASLVWSTGVGKTRGALMAIQATLEKHPDYRILISVPTEVLKEQWDEQLVNFQLESNCTVVIVNTIITKRWECDLLVIDENLSM